MVKNKNDYIEVLWAKIIVYSIIIILCLIFIIIAPKRVFKESSAYDIATSMAITNADSLLLYDYIVYGTEDRFNKGLIDDVEIVNQEFKIRNEILAIKINGDTRKTEIVKDFFLITDPSTPELNIEYYLVRDIMVADIRIPAKTFLTLFDDISTLANNLYVGLLAIVSISILAPVSIKLVKVVVVIKDKNNKIV